MVRMVLPLPHINAFYKDNAIVGTCPDPSSSPCDGSRSEANGTLHAERKQRVLFHYSRSCKTLQLYSQRVCTLHGGLFKSAELKCHNNYSQGFMGGGELE